jgi:protease PrsW
VIKLPAVAPVGPAPVLDVRKFGRTPVGFIAALALISVFALAALVAAVLGGPVPTLVSLVLAVLPVPLVIAGVLYLDRLEPEPPALLALVFGAGAGAAALILLAGKGLGTSVTTPALGPHAEFVRTTLGAALAGALVAESVKGAVLLGLLRFTRQELDGTHDGVVYACMVGLGFALLANLHAYVLAKPGGAGALADAFVLRGVATPLLDPLFSSMIGVGIAYAAMRHGGRGLWAVGVGWVAAVGLHTLWDDSVGVGFAKMATVYVILFFALAMMLLAVVLDRRRIVHLISHYLPAYESSGTLGASDVTMLSSIRRRRLARHWARLHAGGYGLKVMGEYQLAATELVLACDKADRDLVEPAAFSTSCEESLSIMRAATAEFRRRNIATPPWTLTGGSAFGPRQRPPGGQRPAGTAPPAVT